MATAVLIPFTLFVDPLPAIAVIVATMATAILEGDIAGVSLLFMRMSGKDADWAGLLCDDQDGAVRARLGFLWSRELLGVLVRCHCFDSRATLKVLMPLFVGLFIANSAKGKGMR